MTYEELIIEGENEGLTIKEKPLTAHDGRIKGNKIAIRNSLTTVQKKCVLAEELGHHYTTSGDILEQTTVSDQKQELQSRLWSYNKLIGLMGIINAYKAGCKTQHDMANYLDVDESFLADALKRYKSKYGVFTTIDDYIIYFEPSIAILELHSL